MCFVRCYSGLHCILLRFFNPVHVNTVPFCSRFGRKFLFVTWSFGPGPKHHKSEFSPVGHEVGPVDFALGTWVAGRNQCKRFGRWQYIY